MQIRNMALENNNSKNQFAFILHKLIYWEKTDVTKDISNTFKIWTTLTFT